MYESSGEFQMEIKRICRRGFRSQTTQIAVISLCCFVENGWEMYKVLKCTCWAVVMQRLPPPPLPPNQPLLSLRHSCCNVNETDRLGIYLMTFCQGLHDASRQSQTAISNMYSKNNMLTVRLHAYDLSTNIDNICVENVSIKFFILSKSFLPVFSRKKWGERIDCTLIVR